MVSRIDGALMPSLMTVPSATTIHYSNGMVLDVEAGELRAVTIHRADFDYDGDVDLDDLTIFEACSTGPGIPYDSEVLPNGCSIVPSTIGVLPADFDNDKDVDQSDFGVFQRCLSGPGVHPDLNCDD